MKHKRIRYRLKVAIKAKDKYKLEYTITEFETEKVEDKDMELEKAERLLKELVSRDSKYSKTCVKWPFKNRQKKDLNDK